jgi:amino acid permease
MKFFLYILLIVVFILNTFFGLGPVLLADGSFSERMLTLSFVIIIYILIIWIFIRTKQRKKKDIEKDDRDIIK